MAIRWFLKATLKGVSLRFTWCQGLEPGRSEFDWTGMSSCYDVFMFSQAHQRLSSHVTHTRTHEQSRNKLAVLRIKATDVCSCLLSLRVCVDKTE